MMMKREPFHPIVNPLGTTSSQESDEKETPSRPQIVFKALLGISITTHDFPAFCKEYEEILEKAMKTRKLPRQKVIYKAAQLMKLSPENGLDIMAEILGDLNPVIDRIDIYCTHLEFMSSVSVFGSARGSKLHPVEYLHLLENSYPQKCGWKYTQVAKTMETVLQFDHFEGKTSPSWKELQKKVEVEVYYNGAEVNPLISVSDMTLRLVDTYQHGRLDSMTLIRPIIDHASSVASKVRYYEITSIEDLRMITPNVPADMDVDRFVKHPVIYIVWNPKEPRKLVKPSLEWSELYNLTMRKATTMGGCVKNLVLSKDELTWKPDEDYLVPWTKVDVELVEQLGIMHSRMPKSLTLEQLRGEFGS